MTTYILFKNKNHIMAEKNIIQAGKWAAASLSDDHSPSWRL